MNATPPDPPTAAQEVGALLAVTAFIAPLLAVAIVGGFGFIVWMYQLIAGPPGT
ncbi:MAG TPA: periplasmic nitrate reductase, NapE protein [Burkholderiales bacterium]|nr:periplasmic nitrate reductase, NapE protein [Burkholderiales bacterium]